MPIFVKASRTSPTYVPNNGPSMERRTVYKGRCLVQQKLTQGSFGLLPLHLKLKICCFDPKSSFSQFKPRNITRTYLSQNYKSKVRTLEERKEKNLKNPNSTTQ